MAKIENFFSPLKKFKKERTNSKFEKNVPLRGRGILPLSFEPKHNYVGTSGY